MITRTLGSSGLHVSAIGLGCMGLSHAYGLDIAEQDGIDLIRAALELGVTFFDTAQVYGPNHNEELLGRALAGRRHEAVIATKFGFRIVDGRIAGADSSPANVRAVLEGCLQRLGTDHIDLWYQHRLDRTGGRRPGDGIARCARHGRRGPQAHHRARARRLRRLQRLERRHRPTHEARVPGARLLQPTAQSRVGW